MITHDLLICTIQQQWPQLVHGKDYLVAQPIALDTGAQSGDAYIMRWSASPVPEPDIANLLAMAPTYLPVLQANTVRTQRDTLLAGTDWTQGADAPLTADQIAAYKTYREALRNLPTQAGFPSNIAWPTEPA